MLFFSCDDTQNTPASPITNNENAVFDHYTVAYTRTHNNSAETNGSFITAHLQDGRFFSETYEEFVNGQGQGQTTTQPYFYENDRVVKVVYDQNNQRHFFYDDQGRLSGIDAWFELGMGGFYRFVYLDAQKVFFERMSLPYGADGAVVQNRIVLEFDGQDNIVKAGRDADLDGVANWYHNFTYDAADNLTAVHEYGGTALNIAYAPIKDNMAQIAQRTFGKKNLLVYQAECYANLQLEALRHSPDLRMADTQDNLIEVQAVPYYFRKTHTQTMPDFDAVDTTVTTFYFE